MEMKYMWALLVVIILIGGGAVYAFHANTESTGDAMMQVATTTDSMMHDDAMTSSTTMMHDDATMMATTTMRAEGDAMMKK